MSIFFASKQRWAKSVAQDHKLSLRILKDCKIPHITNTCITMPLPPEKPSQHLDVRRWEGSLWHEVCHHKHRDDWIMLCDLKLQLSDPKGDILNIVVDHNIDKKEYGVYPGRDQKTDARFTWAKEQQKLHKQSNIGAENKILTALNAVYFLSIYCRAQWQTNLHWTLWEPLLSKEVKPVFQTLLAAEDGQLQKDFLAVRADGYPNWELTLRIYDVLQDKFSSEKQINLDEDKKEEGESSQEQNTPAEGENQNETGSEETSTGDGETTTEDTESSSTEVSKAHREARIHYTQLTGDINHTSQMNSCDLYIDYTNVQEDPNIYVEPAPIIYMDDDIQNFTFGVRGTRIQENIESSIDQIEWVAQKFRSKLRTRVQNKYQGNKSTGKLAQKKLTAVRTGATQKPFKRKQASSLVLDTAISILIDHSGSMGIPKYTQACLTALALNKCFATLGLPVEIIGYTTSHKPIHIMHKTFAQKKNTQELINSFCRSADKSGCNADGIALTFAHDRLIQRKEHRKLLFVCSDGSPVYTDSHAGCIYTYTKKVIRQIETYGVCELYAIGIQSNNVQDLYKNAVVYTELDSLATDILTHIHTII